MLTVVELKHRIKYDPDTGEFYRLTTRGGTCIGDKTGYIYLSEGILG